MAKPRKELALCRVSRDQAGEIQIEVLEEYTAAEKTKATDDLLQRRSDASSEEERVRIHLLPLGPKKDPLLPPGPLPSIH
ncbi:MAG: hypothetical protein AB7U75_14060 [Hyphomicrobiaceae bacterium]